MKKFCLVCLLVLSLWGCRNQGSPQPLREWMADNGKLKVLSTTAQIGDLVADIGQERVDSWVLIQGTLDPHSYELVKGDGEKLDRADLVFCNGLGLEHGAGLSSFLKTSAKAHAVGDKILEKQPGKVLYKGGAVDPHIWMDISLWKEIVEPIAQKLSSLDPEGSALYQARAAQLLERMEAVHQEIKSALRAVPQQKRYLVTSHDAFSYFARSYLSEEGEESGMRFAAPEGLAPDGQMTPNDIRKMVDYLKAHRIRVIFPESNVNRDSIKKIADASRELGFSVRICREPLYGDAMDRDLHYLDMMRHNASVIVEQLGEP